ncbi:MULTISPECIES: RNA polymerase sigma factor [Microbacterium]|uniref:Sigma-70 family RNA polymerase sigma factor n=1 Tax=Microbacterium wangchenii TaxID=2541726 RepID=A0ABX5SUK0_9MICO|nr:MULTISPECIES: sigma-70 family RNA polymerase sigma factor [Microbacterium]MCK6067599.1 sigma-70 family RNA polymerase sigma factor [Microbacterium sp. EYE_512]QBR89477.1 sigma-70 family RNA polymerase sigma factor [Microbacterium wangchenii]TXK09007.1 sigma-70 family RNA polymerase sigma factor [Microbacterium wangchenii]
MTARHDAIEDLLRTEAPQVLGALVRRFGHFDIAEEAAQDALFAASQQWRQDGLPEHPRSWLIRIAYRRMIDTLRAESADRRRQEQYVASEPNAPFSPPPDHDDSLNLLLLCCHPALSSASRVALTLRAVGGLTTAEIAHAYGVTEQTMAVRISRAKQQIRKSGARFEFTADDDFPGRLFAVMRVLYLIFNEGYTVTTGAELSRTDLTGEAIRLARLLRTLVPDDPEPAGLLALMLLIDSRRATRTTANGDLIPLAEQDRTRWDQEAIQEGSDLIRTAWSQGNVGTYRLQAAIAAVHASAAVAEETDWEQIAALYLALEQVEPSGLVMLARVVAVAHAFGPARANALLEELDRDHGLLQQPLTRHRAHAIRAHLREAEGAVAAAREDFLAAADMTKNEPESRYLSRKADGE